MEMKWNCACLQINSGKGKRYFWFKKAHYFVN